MVNNYYDSKWYKVQLGCYMRIDEVVYEAIYRNNSTLMYPEHVKTNEFCRQR